MMASEQLELNHRLKELENVMEAAGDRLRAGKMEQLRRKLEKGQMLIAFCGHFSAGKSTLVNRLCETALLPSSPIPTSANIVAIFNGKEKACVFHRGGGKGEGASRSVPLAELAAYCKNGADIERVEIQYPLPFLGNNAGLLDTPGIDSTDDAHRMSTESALHLADAVFYVMDYNHVQSELNFAFARQMAEWGKPLYLIVNQIDKHREEELPFDLYRQSVEQAFRSWNIEPDGIFCTSLREPGHPHNDWPRLKPLLERLIGMRRELVEYSAAHSALHLIEEHAAAEAARHEGEKARLLREIENEGLQTDAELARLAGLDRKIAELGQRAESVRSGLHREIAGIAENANITPAATRDLADAYLQSRKTGFKVGIFGRAAKTAKEIERRLEVFFRDFREKVDIHLERHIRDALKKACEAHGLDDPALFAAIDGLRADVTPGQLAAEVQSGAGLSGEYTLNYCRKLAADVKERCRRDGFALADAVAEACGAAAQAEAEALAGERAAVAARLGAYRALQELEAGERSYLQELLACLGPAPARPALPAPAAFAAARAASAAAAPPQRQAAAAAVRGPARAASAALAAASRRGDPLREMAGRLREAADALAGIAALRSVVRDMRAKEAKLRERTFTIALFGAFSAGKSSFANALMGERVLPVSPNPTTAAINRIVPPKEGWPHGMARVVMKTEQQVLADVQYSLQALGLEPGDKAASLKRIASLRPGEVGARGKPHYAFLKAVSEGWADAEPLFGQELRADREAFARYVAEEQKSCFVDGIELHYDNELTREGMIFVDTPGADSVNARHTGVAFNYIKNADAILFVTYYNHAFSQADREFLLQLGRVKDSFELDKMFFIVNAADLASSGEELAGVVAHVEENLLQHGIRRPRIFPVSSQMAVAGRISGDDRLVRESGIAQFEREFLRFSREELGGMALRSARFELERASSLLEDWIRRSREGEQERARQAAGLRRAASGVLEIVDPGADDDIRELEREAEELLYYVKQRIFYRFNEFFSLSFNPAVLREDRNIRQAMAAAWNDFLGNMIRDLSQEVLASTLRLENFLEKLARKRYERWIGLAAERLPGFQSAEFPEHAYATPEIGETMEVPDVELRWLLASFRNARSFFEGQGREKLQEELMKRMAVPVAGYLQAERIRLAEHYAEEYRGRLAALANRVKEAVQEHADGQLEALEMKMDFTKLEKMKQALNRLIP
jgi:GTPase Era involved in 16S rRNA processing